MKHELNIFVPDLRQAYARPAGDREVVRRTLRAHFKHLVVEHTASVNKSDGALSSYDDFHDDTTTAATILSPSAHHRTARTGGRLLRG